MKCWVGLVGWPVADGLPTSVVTHQLQVERRTESLPAKLRRSTTVPRNQLSYMLKAGTGLFHIAVVSTESATSLLFVTRQCFNSLSCCCCLCCCLISSPKNVVLSILILSFCSALYQCCMYIFKWLNWRERSWIKTLKISRWTKLPKSDVIPLCHATN